ncbi:MAG: hypothetical protein ACJAQ0_001723 [Dasania sp.]|jgi:hypothetical protein
MSTGIISAGSPASAGGGILDVPSQNYIDISQQQQLFAPSGNSELTGNRLSALFEAGGNKQQNFQNQADSISTNHTRALEVSAFSLNADLKRLGIALQEKTLGLHEETVGSQALATNVHSFSIASLNKKIDELSLDDPQYARKLNTLVNSITSVSQAASQVNANITTSTAKGHGSLQTSQQGALGVTSTTSNQGIDADIVKTEIGSDTQLGLADRKVTLDTTLGGLQSGVANNQINSVGATVAQGQQNYLTGIGQNTAGFTNGFNSNANYNISGLSGGGIGAFGALGGLGVGGLSGAGGLSTGGLGGGGLGNFTGGLSGAQNGNIISPF